MTNQEIIKAFYSAFQNKDSKAMNAFLADDICFEDPAFGKLEGDDVKYMWQFLTENAKDFSMTFSKVKADQNSGSAHWEAHYTFSATGNQVINKVNSNFTFQNGKINTHIDDFDLKKWVKQAMGSAVGLFGGSFLIKNAVQKKSRGLLAKYKKKNNLL